MEEDYLARHMPGLANIVLAQAYDPDGKKYFCGRTELELYMPDVFKSSVVKKAIAKADQVIQLIEMAAAKQ